jgi:uncharacterized protein
MTIERHDDGKRGYVEAVENNIQAGKMTYTWVGEAKIIIDHTEVGVAFGGKGVGKKLLMEMVKFAREKQLRIMPLCPFARAMFERDKSIGDVLF